jgi:hypothetical protein
LTHTAGFEDPPYATHYSYQDGVQIPQPMDYVEDYPTGSSVSTAEERSHFILAHLDKGKNQPDRLILKGRY